MIVNTSINLPPPSYLSLDNGNTLAYIHSVGDSPGIFYLPGFQSTMKSTKSRALFHFCQEKSLEFTTLDYYNHGESTRSDDTTSPGTIGRWLSDAMTVLDQIPENSSQIFVGSSMGSWLMMLLLQSRPERVSGLVGIASAPDFTSLIAQDISANPLYSSQMQTMGYCEYPTKYDARGFYRIHKELLEEAQSHFILEHERKFDLHHEIPLRLIHGKQDEDVDYNVSIKLLDRISSCDNKRLILVDDGDHRLSKPKELEVILHAIEEII